MQCQWQTNIARVQESYQFDNPAHPVGANNLLSRRNDCCCWYMSDIHPHQHKGTHHVHMLKIQCNNLKESTVCWFSPMNCTLLNIWINILNLRMLLAFLFGYCDGYMRTKCILSFKLIKSLKLHISPLKPMRCT